MSNQISNFFKLIFPCIFMMMFPALIFSQPTKDIPAHFKEVDQTLWLVEDLEKIIGEWEKLGFTQISDLGKVSAKFKSSGAQHELRVARANLGGGQFTWIQVLQGNSVFTEFHQNYGDGAMSLVHRLDGRRSIKKEIKRLAGLGIEVLEEVTFKSPKGKWTYVLMDTQAKGKYILGYVFGEPDKEISAGLSAENYHQMQITQYAFAVEDAGPCSVYWEQMGFPKIEITHAEVRDKRFRSRPANFDMNLGWQRHGSVVYEWCIPLRSPTVYETHIGTHGEGIQHLGFSVRDIDEVIRDYESKGYSISMSGAWGEKDRPGSGRFAYVDLESAGGLTMELLWSYRED